MKKKYGVLWRPLADARSGSVIGEYPDWMIERDMFLLDEQQNIQKFPGGYLGKAEHFRRMMTCLLCYKETTYYFEWNPNSVRITDEYFKHRFLAVAGHASSAKTKTQEVLAVGEFIAYPKETAVLVTSTTINDARKRIWGGIENCWNAVKEFLGEENMPGVLLSSQAIIRYRYVAPSGNLTNDTTKGIMLVPGQESEAEAGVGRMKGFKARRMRMMGDEWADLSPKLLSAAETNLMSNMHFKLNASFNPSSFFGSDGTLAEPKDGWGSINQMERDGWETKRGYCIRFDAEKSPNVIAGREKWRGLITREQLEEAKERLGEGTSGYIQQYRGAWSETGNADSIYSEAELIKYQAMRKVEAWENTPVMCGGFDPAFTHGGDRAALVLGKAGRASIDGRFKPCIEITDVKFLDENIDTSKDKKEQVLERLKLECIKAGLDPRNLAMDSTGGGDVFATLMARDGYFSTNPIKVNFSSKPSNLASEKKYYNMASELWYAGKPLLREGQIRGIRPEIAREMTLRLYSEVGKPSKVKIESKEDMKKRLGGRSPDICDAAMLVIFAARSRLGLQSTEHSAPKGAAQKKAENPYAEFFSWGKKKPQPIREQGYVSSDAGWADGDSGGISSLFG